ncbi:VOC family protein [Aureimonas leprariae]|uniref:VOC family protein n=1 Tax=Plantimonas leprariae TaxID=2615207 RepID=A0A7V7TY64_9HYPH|nr:VOC family protein [Aureimonas leprariae]KAB0682860.1 VOC family protein [Aureimonas leprariae]
MSRIALATVLVADYDEAIGWYAALPGFRLRDDTPLGEGKRWVVVGPKGGCGLLIALAADEAQRAAIGNQAAGRVAFFLHTDDFVRDHAAMLAAGVVFVEEPRHEPYGTVAVFRDLYGNLWDLIEPKSGAA